MVVDTLIVASWITVWRGLNSDLYMDLTRVKKKQLIQVGFEPTHANISELESDSLDRSDTEPDEVCIRT